MNKLNYHTSPAVLLIPAIVEFLKTLQKQLEEENILCGFAGSEIVFVYGFKGDLNAVKNQFSAYINVISNKSALSYKDRLELAEYANRHKNFTHADPYAQLAKNALKNFDMNNFFDLWEKSLNIRMTWHEKKQCICFCNN